MDASGYFDFYYQEFGIRTEGGKIVVTGMVKTENAFMDAANTANSEAGPTCSGTTAATRRKARSSVT